MSTREKKQGGAFAPLWNQQKNKNNKIKTQIKLFSTYAYLYMYIAYTK